MNKKEKYMPKEVEEAFADIRNDAKIEAYVTLFRQGLISEEVVLSNLKLSKEELENIIVELKI